VRISEHLNINHRPFSRSENPIYRCELDEQLLAFNFKGLVVTKLSNEVAYDDLAGVILI
jgi:hypothetical protein